MHWMDASIHFIDFEGSLSSGILEYGVVTLKGGEIVHTRTRLCRAIGRIRPDDVLVHKLDEKVWPRTPRSRTTSIIHEHS